MSHSRYVIIVLCMCAIAYGALFFLVSSPLYCKISTSYGDLSPCTKFRTAGKDAQVLLVGDSSLLYGVRPAVVQAVAGETVYNDGVVGGLFPFNPIGVIDNYLRHNRRPRAIVVYLSPTAVLDPGTIHDRVWFPLGLAALHSSGVVSWNDVLRNRPMALFELPAIAFANIGFSTARNRQRVAAIEAAAGFFDYSAVVPDRRRQINVCTDNADKWQLTPDIDRAEIDRIKTHYAASGLPIYFYLAPFSHCGTDTARTFAAYAGLADNRPAVLDDALFVNDGMHVHVNAAGSQIASQMLGQFIRDRRIGYAP